jgi:hypothetical protein
MATVQRPASADFLALARTGRTEWWRWVLGLGVILVFWLVLGGIPSAVRTTMGDSSTDGYGFYVVANLSFLFFLMGIWLAVAKIHRRGLRTLVTPHRRVSLATIGAGLLCWVAATAVVVGVSVLVGAELQWALDPARFFLFLPIVLLLTPIQATVEELFFRGYLLQGSALLMRRRWLLATLNGVLFALPHATNRETAASFWLLMLYYWAFGAFMALVTIHTNTTELAIGVHVANNLLGAVVISFEGSSLTTETIFTTGSLDAAENLISFVLTAGLFVLFAAGWRRARHRTGDPVREVAGLSGGRRAR